MQDDDKVYNFLIAFLKGVMEPSKPQLVSLRTVHTRLKLARLRLNQLHDVIGDQLAGTDLMMAHGWWVFTEVENDVHAFIRLASAAQCFSMFDSEDDEELEECEGEDLIESVEDVRGWKALVVHKLAVRGRFPINIDQEEEDGEALSTGHPRRDEINRRQHFDTAQRRLMERSAAVVEVHEVPETRKRPQARGKKDLSRK